ncbi:MAG: nicotinate (nicotinamide) nucleotide adenylyltransferase [Oscillospiraceae bacterium]|nr:nicotinate (nicotinamide) nucleotide adenylyltransferase [Oscillospiraceae bacterium]
MLSIGIMGGTFNPIHNGHIEIAKAAYEQYNLDEVWFMPNHIPGYKDKTHLISGEKRLAMVELAIKDYPYFKTSDFELKREGNTYTAETMQLLGKEYPNIHFYFIIGEDSLNYFDKWKEPETILAYSDILVAPRDESSTDSMQKRITELHEMYGNNHFFPIICPKIDCSSSELREKLILIQNESTKLDFKQSIPYLNQDVFSYIIQNELYKN